MSKQIEDIKQLSSYMFSSSFFFEEIRRIKRKKPTYQQKYLWASIEQIKKAGCGIPTKSNMVKPDLRCYFVYLVVVMNVILIYNFCFLHLIVVFCDKKIQKKHWTLKICDILRGIHTYKTFCWIFTHLCEKYQDVIACEENFFFRSYRIGTPYGKYINNACI